MIWHVYERARQCTALRSVALATDDDRIRTAAENWGIPVIMTRKDHSSGTDRVQEAASKLNLPKDAVVVNIQGDEPALDPAMLTELVLPFEADDVQVTTLARKINSAEASNPDLVKVVFAENGRALYFSRSAIPHNHNAQKSDFFGHIGIYGFRMQALTRFVSLKPSRLEISEKLEQLRLLENNIQIHIVKTKYLSKGVDRPADIETVSQIILGKKTRRLNIVNFGLVICLLFIFSGNPG